MEKERAEKVRKDKVTDADRKCIGNCRNGEDIVRKGEAADTGRKYIGM